MQGILNLGFYEKVFKSKKVVDETMKKSGPCDNPNGSLKNSNFPKAVVKAFLGIDSSSNLMW